MRGYQSSTLVALGVILSIGAAHAAEPAPIAVTDNCALRGRAPFARGTKIYQKAKGDRVVGVFSGVLTPAKVSAIPRSDKTARARVSTSDGTPAFRIDGYVAPAEIPVYTTRDVTVVPSHIWIAAQQEVKVAGATADSLQVVHRIRGTQKQDVRATAPCTAFALAPISTPPLELVDDSARGYRMRVTTLPIYDRPRGDIIFTLYMLEGATLLFWADKSRAGYTHVTGRSDIVINGWVKRRGLEAMRPGELMDPYVASQPTGAQLGLSVQPQIYVAEKDVPIRPGPEPEEPIIGYIETGAEFYLFSYIEGWATVLPRSLAVKPPDGGGFWVPEIDVMP